MCEALVARVRYHIQKANFMGLKEAESTLLLGEAADAIEKLQAIVEGYESSTNMVFVEKDGETVIEFVPRWIPVAERLPEKNGSYLVYVYGEVTEMDCWHGEWYRLGDNYTKAVTHWMSLPPAPREEE